MDNLEETSASRKRQHSGSCSPSENESEQNLKKIRIGTDEPTSLNNEASENVSSTLQHSEGKPHCEQNTSDTSNHEKMEECHLKDEVKNQSNKSLHEEKSNESPKRGDDEPTTNEKSGDVNEKREFDESEHNILENSKIEENSDHDSDKEDKNMNGEGKLDDSMQLSSDVDNQKVSDEHTPKKMKPDIPNSKLTPKQLQKKLNAERRQQEKQKEKEERMRKIQEEKERVLQDKLKKKEMKDKEIEQKREEKKKEREEKEEKKRKEREEKEQKRKEKEEKEELKRKEREQEKLKKQQEIEEKNKEKLKEEEKKQKAAAAFVNFFVPKKSDEIQDEKKVHISNFLEFEVKSDMKLPLPRREALSPEEKEKLETYIRCQEGEASYLKDLSSGKPIGKSSKTWPCEETTEDDVILVDLGETICEDKASLQRYKAKFLHFHQNRRPAYYGTWRKKSKRITPRKPFAEDTALLNYEEESDDDWEEEEQGESLNGSEDEAEKENEDEKDDYDIDNEFFVPHGHLSDDEVDDEEMARLSPESLKQKLKLLKEEFDHDMQSKTHKLKPRSIGCIWYNKDGSNVEEAVDRYLQPLAVITRHHRIVIKSRIDIPNFVKEKKNRLPRELDPELVPSFLKMIHRSASKKSHVVEQFLTEIQKIGNSSNVSKGLLFRTLKQSAVWEKYRDEDTKKYKFRWIVKPNLLEKYGLIE